MTRYGRVSLIVGLVVATVLVIAGSSHAHVAPEPLENEVHILEDQPQDEFYWYDGYDLHHLHAREALNPQADEHGIIYRFTLYGGFAPASTADQLHIDIEATGPNGTETVRMTTEDDEQWSPSHGHLVYKDVTEDDPPWTGVTAQIQWFIPYDAWGANIGDQLSDITMYSWADEDLRDKAPGGVYVPNSGGQAEIPPEAELESIRYVDLFDLEGPTGYVDLHASTNKTHATVNVESAVSNGQHITLSPVPTEGWNATLKSPASISIDQNETARFTLTLEASQNATGPIPLRVTTDLGGDRVLHVGALDEHLVASLSPNAVDVDVEEITQDDVPFPPGAVVASLIGLAGLLRRPER